ncbi:MAG: PilZ domain-containing protein [Terriglobia bacterium]
MKASNRAARFPIHIPVRYREPCGRAWIEGKTENISRSGVLFRTESVLSPKTAVEVRLALPVVIEDEAPCEILCKGVVVRVEQSSIRGAPPALAVAIQHYRLSRGRQVN